MQLGGTLAFPPPVCQGRSLSVIEPMPYARESQQLLFLVLRMLTEHAGCPGFIQYVNQSQCEVSGIITTTASQVRMGVDVRVVQQAPRMSVRLASKEAYTRGLFLIDVEHMPTGCATWPAFWLCGPSWPSHGEIDIIEGVNTMSQCVPAPCVCRVVAVLALPFVGGGMCACGVLGLWCCCIFGQMRGRPCSVPLRFQSAGC